MKSALRLSLAFIFILSAWSAAPGLDRDSAEKRIHELSTEITRHNYLYYVLGKPEISNAEYDRLYDELLGLEKSFPELALPDSPIKRVGSQENNTFQQVRHTVPMLSLDKSNSLDELVSWAEKIRQSSGGPLPFSVEEKIDGAALEVIYEKGVFVQALTRGNGIFGYDVSKNVKTIKALPHRLNSPVSLVLRGEVFIKKSDFADLNKKSDFSYDSPRNLAAGVLRRKDSREVAEIPLDIFIFEAVSGDFDEKMNHEERLAWLKELGIKINPHNRTVKHVSELKSCIRNIISSRGSLDYEIDGVVIKVNEISARELLGQTERFPLWAKAYKFEASEAETVIKQIKVQIGRLGRAVPVALFHPVKIGGVSISRAALHNQAYIEELGLAPGDRVRIARRGDVIPSLEAVIEKNNFSVWQMPLNCPVCSAELKKDGKHHICPNPGCPGQIKAGLLWFSKKMGIKYLGPKNIEILTDRKYIQYPEDIYSIDEEVLKTLKGFGDKKIQAFKASLEASKAKSFETVLLALGIPGLGKSSIRLLINAGYDSVDKILDAGLDNLSDIKGIGKETAFKIMDKFQPRFMQTIQSLKKQGLKL